MFATTNLENDNPQALAKLLFPDMANPLERVPKNYSLNSPYQLIFTGIKTEEFDNYFSSCYIRPNAALYTQSNQDEAFPYLSKSALHKHDFFEIMFVLSGDVYVKLENERHVYRKGDSCILSKNVMHAEEYSTDFEIVFLEISTNLMTHLYEELSFNYFDIENVNTASAMTEFLSKNLGADANLYKSYVDFIPNGNDDDIVATLHNYFDQITRETLNPQIDSTIQVLQTLKQLLIYLSQPNIFSTTPVQIGSHAEQSIFESIISAMEETDGRISRSQLSERLNYSGAYLNELCKKYSGKALFDYGMTFCMKKSAQFLTTSNDNINDIGLVLGFSNTTHFYKIFKEYYGMTPAQYRRKNR